MNIKNNTPGNPIIHPIAHIISIVTFMFIFLFLNYFAFSIFLFLFESPTGLDVSVTTQHQVL